MAAKLDGRVRRIEREIGDLEWRRAQPVPQPIEAKSMANFDWKLFRRLMNELFEKYPPRAELWDNMARFLESRPARLLAERNGHEPKITHDKN